MTGKRAAIALISALLAFGYIFTLNPQMAAFKLVPGTSAIETSFALVLFMFFLAGFGLALFGTAFKEGLRTFQIWRRDKRDLRRGRATRLVIEGRGNAVLGKTGVARRLLQKAQRNAPGERYVALEMARVEVADGKLDAAERRLKALLSDDPKNAEVISLLEQVYAARGDFEGQVASLSRWLEAEPRHPGALTRLRDLYAEKRNWAEAARIQERLAGLAERREGRGIARRRLSELRYRQARAWPAARAKPLLERIVKEDDGFAPAHGALGDSQLELGDREGAIQTWLRGYHATGQAGLLLKVEQEREREGRLEEALKLYRKFGKKGGIAVLLQARLLLHMERAQEALRTVEERADGKEYGRAAALLKGEALYRLRSFDEAARYFRESVFGQDLVGVPFTFRCGNCGNVVSAWDGQCPRCEHLDTLQVSAGVGAPLLGEGG